MVSGIIIVLLDVVVGYPQSIFPDLFQLELIFAEVLSRVNMLLQLYYHKLRLSEMDFVGAPARALLCRLFN